MHFPSVRSVVLFDDEGKYALGHKWGHGGAIQFPRRARTQPTLLHEFAHLASPPAALGNGPVYAGIYLLLVQHCMPERVTAQLASHFSAPRAGAGVRGAMPPLLRPVPPGCGAPGPGRTRGLSDQHYVSLS
jgi:hypothetical protein